MADLESLVAVLIRPSDGLRTVCARPRSLMTVLLLMASLLALHAVTTSRIDREAMERVTAARLAHGDKGQQVAEEEIEKEATLALNGRRIFGYAGIVVGVPVGIGLLAWFFWLVGRCSRPRVRFRTSYALVAHACVPLALRQLMAVPVVLTYPGLHPNQTRGLFHTDLGSLWPQAAALPGACLVDPFWIWIAVLFALGGRAAGWARWQAAAGGLVAWGLIGLAGHGLL